MITENIAELVNYGIAAGLVNEADKVYTTNTLLELGGLSMLSRRIRQPSPIRQHLTSKDY